MLSPLAGGPGWGGRGSAIGLDPRIEGVPTPHPDPSPQRGREKKSSDLQQVTTISTILGFGQRRFQQPHRPVQRQLGTFLCHDDQHRGHHQPRRHRRGRAHLRAVPADRHDVGPRLRRALHRQRERPIVAAGIVLPVRTARGSRLWGRRGVRLGRRRLPGREFHLEPATRGLRQLAILVRHEVVEPDRLARLRAASGKTPIVELASASSAWRVALFG